MIIPNDVSIFGSQQMTAAFSTGGHYILSFKLSRTMRKALNQPSEPCTNNKRPDTSRCIAKWIQNAIGCRVKMYGKSNLDKLPLCSSESQMKELVDILFQLKLADAKIIYEKTGCMASCIMYIYGKLEHMQQEHLISFRSCKRQNISCTMDMMLEIPQHEITFQGTRQYIVYDFNSFIADVGGYMGLLLGFSALSLYNEVENILKRQKFCSLPK